MANTKTKQPADQNMSDASDVNMSVGNIRRRQAAPIKTDGIKIRGTGAATKGLKARGPMG